MYDKLIYELSKPGRRAYSLPKSEVKEYSLDKQFARSTSLDLASVSELDVVRHYTKLSLKNFGVDQGFYPLGSCTMKYNPKIDEEIASLPNFKNIHPLQDEDSFQGMMQIYYETSELLSEITGMAEFTFNPFAGAHGELTGLMIMKQYHLNRGDTKRTKVIVPDSAHGTNPASSALCGFEVVQVASTENGTVDINALKPLLDDTVAGIMMTNPNTVGIFESDILEIAKLMHENGSLLYYDGANLNAILGVAKPALMGFDIMHINLHKTFATPHGGGGPGSGAVGVRADLVDLLPSPRIKLENGKYHFYNISPLRVSGFYGNANVVIKAWCYILSLGKENIANVAKYAVLNANYVKESLKDYYKLPISNICKHEVVFDGLISGAASTLDVAKRLLDYGYHPPTIYFPLLFHQALMIEPTENESKETLDEFIDCLINIAKEAETNPEILHNAPHTTIVKRLDDVLAARRPILTYKDYLQNKDTF